MFIDYGHRKYKKKTKKKPKNWQKPRIKPEDEIQPGHFFNNLKKTTDFNYNTLAQASFFLSFFALLLII